VHALGARRARVAAFALLRLVWRLQPDVILSGAAEISFLVLLLRGLLPGRTRVLIRQNGTVSSVRKMGVPRYTRLLYRLLYRRADRIICQSRAMAEDMMREVGIGAEKLAVLPNPVDVDGIRRAMNDAYAWEGPGPHLLAVGRLSHEKGFDLLIEAFATVRTRFADARLILAGSGREEAELRRLCHVYGVEDAVQFAGRVNCPYIYFPGATLFVLPSRCEGMPNALLEASSAGLPIVATPASGGIVDLLRGKRGAWVAPEISAAALAQTMVAALKEIRPGERFPVMSSGDRGALDRSVARSVAGPSARAAAN
jgi:glycosyltransferase involved in cell wall biosynthesis